MSSAEFLRSLQSVHNIIIQEGYLLANSRCVRYKFFLSSGFWLLVEDPLFTVS